MSVSMEPSWYVCTHPNRTTLYLLYTSLCTGELNAIRKHKCFLCSPCCVKGLSLGYVGLNLNPKDLKDLPARSLRLFSLPSPQIESRHLHQQLNSPLAPQRRPELRYLPPRKHVGGLPIPRSPPSPPRYAPVELHWRNRPGAAKRRWRSAKKSTLLVDMFFVVHFIAPLF